MKYLIPPFVVLAVLAGPMVLLSAEKPKESHPPAAATLSLDDNPTLKEVSFHGARLSEVVAYLRNSCPGFKAVVVADPQCPDPDPTLPGIQLKNIDLQQFLDVLKQTLPQLSMNEVNGQHGTVCLFKLSAPAVPVTSGMSMAEPGPAAQSPRLQVYRLSHLIPADAADRTKALNDILSLVQAALEAQGPATNALMRVHEATGTLIFRGNAAQTEAVEQALKALVPTTGESERAKMRDQMQAERQRLDANMQTERQRLDADRQRMAERERDLVQRMDELKMEAADARKRISEETTEIEVLKARLAAQGDKKP